MQRIFCLSSLTPITKWWLTSPFSYGKWWNDTCNENIARNENLSPSKKALVLVLRHQTCASTLQRGLHIPESFPNNCKTPFESKIHKLSRSEKPAHFNVLFGLMGNGCAATKMVRSNFTWYTMKFKFWSPVKPKIEIIEYSTSFFTVITLQMRNCVLTHGGMVDD